MRINFNFVIACVDYFVVFQVKMLRLYQLLLYLNQTQKLCGFSFKNKKSFILRHPSINSVGSNQKYRWEYIEYRYLGQIFWQLSLIFSSWELNFLEIFKFSIIIISCIHRIFFSSGDRILLCFFHLIYPCASYFNFFFIKYHFGISLELSKNVLLITKWMEWINSCLTAISDSKKNHYWSTVFPFPCKKIESIKTKKERPKKVVKCSSCKWTKKKSSKNESMNP